MNRADNRRRRFSTQPASPTTWSTNSGGQDRVKTPSPSRSRRDTNTNSPTPTTPQKQRQRHCHAIDRGQQSCRARRTAALLQDREEHDGKHGLELGGHGFCQALGWAGAHHLRRGGLRPLHSRRKQHICLQVRILLCCPLTCRSAIPNMYLQQESTGCSHCLSRRTMSREFGSGRS